MADFLSETENSVNVPPNHDDFPVGLRVLVVDNDPTVLKIIEETSAQCNYLVTTCNDACVALNLLREKRDSFDVVMSDIHMPNIDGYKFLQHVDQEFNLPVVMMSVDGSSSSVMEGLMHGACHYLIKPFHQDDIRNIWQHVIRKKTQDHNNNYYGVLEYNDPNQIQGNNINDDDDAEYTRSVRDGRKRSLSRESDDGVEIGEDDLHHHHPMPPAKKPRRFVWTTERHQQFVDAMAQLGDKAVPKKILELMNIPELTRENVASHLQKYRLHLKSKSEETERQNGMLNGSSSFSEQALANADGSRHVSPQTQAGLDAEGNTRSISENHSHSDSNYASSQACSGTLTTAAPKYDSNNNINIPSNLPPLAVKVASLSSTDPDWVWPSPLSPCEFLEEERNKRMHINAMPPPPPPPQMMMMIHEPSFYRMAPLSQLQQYGTSLVGNSPVSAVNSNNNNYSFVGRNYSVLDQSTFSPQLNNNNNNSSSPLSNIAELYGLAAPQVLAFHPTSSSRTQQQQQLHLHSGGVRQFHGLPHVSHAQVVPYGSGCNIDSSLHHQGQVESHSGEVDTMQKWTTPSDLWTGY